MGQEDSFSAGHMPPAICFYFLCPTLGIPSFFKCRLLSVFYLYYLPSLSVFEEKGSLIQTCDYWSLDLLKNTLHLQDRCGLYITCDEVSLLTLLFF